MSWEFFSFLTSFTEVSYLHRNNYFWINIYRKFDQFYVIDISCEIIFGNYTLICLAPVLPELLFY